MLHAQRFCVGAAMKVIGELRHTDSYVTKRRDTIF